MAIRPDEDDVAVPPSQWRRHCLRLLTAGCVVAATITGAALPLLLIDSGFRGYVSQARIEVTQASYDAPDATRFLAMARRTLLSPAGLDRISGDLKLKPADMVGVRNQGELGLLVDLLTGADARPLSPREALNGAVGEAIRLELTPDENTLIVTAKAATPEGAMRLTDYLSMRVMADGKAGTMTPAMRETERARTRLDEAEAALNGFQMRHGDSVLSEVQQLEQQLREVNDSLAGSTQYQQSLQADLTVASSTLKPNDVLSKPLPAGAAFAALEDIRQKHATASMTLASVSVDYGPKHPRRIAAQNAVDAVQALAAPALRQVVEGLRVDEKRIAQEIATANGERKKHLDRLEALGVAPGELSRLQAELETARNAYLEASERRELSSSSTPAIETRLAKKAGPGELSRDLTQAAMMAGGGGLIGLLGSLYLLSYRRHDEEQEDALAVENEARLTASMDGPEQSLQFSEFEQIEPAVFDDLEVLAAEDYVQPEDAFADYYAEAANDADDMPLDERVRQVLMGNRTVRSATQMSSELPPLLSEALAGHFDHEQAEAEELAELRRELAHLRERLADYADHQDDYRKTA